MIKKEHQAVWPMTGFMITAKKSRTQLENISKVEKRTLHSGHSKCIAFKNNIEITIFSGENSQHSLSSSALTVLNFKKHTVRKEPSFRGKSETQPAYCETKVVTMARPV